MEARSPERGDQSLCQSQPVCFLAQETGGGSPFPGLPSPFISTQASFPAFFQLSTLSLPPPGVCRPGLPYCLLLSPSKADLGSRNVPEIEEGQFSILGDMHIRRGPRERQQ